MKHQRFCHNCGADVTLDEPIRIDDFSMVGDAFPFCYRGEPLNLTAGERTVIWSLMKAYPDHVTKPTLLDRIGSDGMNNLIQVLVCRIRAKLREIGAPDPIETVHNRGYRWKPGGGDEVAETLATGEKPIGELLNQLYNIPGTTDREAE